MRQEFVRGQRRYILSLDVDLFEACVIIVTGTVTTAAGTGAVRSFLKTWRWPSAGLGRCRRTFSSEGTHCPESLKPQ